MNASKPLLSSLDGRLFTIQLTCPERRNALSAEMITALRFAFEEAHAMPEAKVILLKAQGTSFCAGADLSELRKAKAQTFEENLSQSQELGALFRRIYSCSKPVVAEVQGPALGGGCGLVSVCDIVLSSEAARFGCPEARIGFVAAIIMPFLLRRIGETQAKALTLSTKQISATEAQSIGLVQYIHPPEVLESATQALISHMIEENSAQSMELTKKLLYRLHEAALEHDLNYAIELNASTRSSADFQLGIRRFLSKEPQQWRDK